MELRELNRGSGAGAWLVLCLGIACGEEAPEMVQEIPELTSCERALGNLHSWSEATEISSQRQAALMVACEDGRALATSDRLECLLSRTPEEAVRCTIAAERQGLIEACIEDGGEDLREDCESLAEPGPALLEARVRPLQDGRWLELWTCHAPSEEMLAPAPEQLLICGLLVWKQIYLEDCERSGMGAAGCEAGWKIESPSRQIWLNKQLHPERG